MIRDHLWRDRRVLFPCHVDSVPLVRTKNRTFLHVRCLRRVRIVSLRPRILSGMRMCMGLG
jgi:hypothetical protein